MTDLHVIFGAGQVGRPLARRLLELGMRVRVVRRTRGAVTDGCELRAGDALDPAFCRDAAVGATAVYHCMNPPYDARAWAEQVPRYMDNLIAAAGQAGARLVVLDNLYMLAPPRGRMLDEQSPTGPVSRKGAIRARAAERLFDAHGRGEVAAVCGRASDFYGPGGTLTGLGDYFWPRVLAGKAAYSPYPLDAVHTYHYIPDVAMALAALGCADPEVCGQIWMLPCQPAEPLSALVARLASHLGREIRARQLPRFVLKGLALVVPIMRELDEMLYQWEEPFIVDDRRFRRHFRIEPTGLDEAAAATLKWALQRYRT